MFAFHDMGELSLADKAEIIHARFPSLNSQVFRWLLFEFDLRHSSLSCGVSSDLAAGVTGVEPGGEAVISERGSFDPWRQ